MLMAAGLAMSTAGSAQMKNLKTDTVKVFGNCEMCKTNIEKAAKKNKISAAEWNEHTRMATITYDSRKTILDAVLKNIALAGYDNEKFLAPDASYNKLADCCKYVREKKQVALTTAPVEGAHSPAQQQDRPETPELTNSKAPDSQLTTVFDSYFALKDALVQTNFAKAADKAKSLQTAIDGVKMEKLSTPVHTVWMKVLEELKEDAAHISTAKDIAHHRHHFMSLSKNMYELVKVSKQAETVYYQFCPMANGGRGANWLSKESGIKNPYYGAQMLTCGNTVETIK